MDVERFLVEVVKNTNSWVVVVIFLLYVVYHIYRKHAEGAALKQSLDILEGTIRDLLEHIDANVRTLANRIDVFIGRVSML